MRVYGRVNGVWQEVQTDAAGHNDYVYLTALIQCLKLNLNESPFWADWGIPAQQSVIQQIIPDFYVMLIQQRYAGYFASLSIVRTSTLPPTYSVTVTTNQGVIVQRTIVV
jgi:hypothetical protein